MLNGGRKGSVLVAVLWSLYFLGALALVINVLVTPQLELAAKLRDRAVLRYLAKAGIERAILELRADETEEYDTLNESWSNNEEGLKQIDVSDEGCASLQYIHFEDVEEEGITRYGLIDEERKINLNSASKEILKNFFEIVTETSDKDAADIAAAIIDWRDADDDPVKNGAESYYYEALEDGYPCKNAPFEAVEELLLVKGVTQGIFDAVKSRVTVYGRGQVNINTADLLVLQSLGMSQVLAGKVIEYRSGNDGQEGTEDDNPFESPGEVIAKVSSVRGLLPEEKETLEALMEEERIGVRSQNFHGYAVGQFYDLSNAVGIEFIINRDRRIRYWRED